MAYRFYLTSDAAAISPTPNSGWEQTAGVTRGKLSFTKAGSNAALAIAETTATTNFDVLIGQWVSDPMTHAGSIDLVRNTITVARQESSTSADFSTRWVIRILSGDGATIRSDEGFVDSVEWATTSTAVTNSFSDLDTDVACQVGDRIVIEYGYKANNSVTTSFTGTIRHGGTAGDLANGDTANVATHSPWVEFADERIGDLFAPADPPDGYRLYLTAASSPISPTASGSWEDATQVTRGLLSPTKSGANAAIAASETSASATHDVLIGQWSSAPITRADTLSGQWSATVARLESDAAANFDLVVVVRVLSGDGSVVRGTFESASLTAPTFSTEFPTTLTAETVGPFTGDNVSCQVGDRIVVELGYRTNNTSTSSFTGTLRHGGTATADLAPGDAGTEATTRSPFIEFHDPDMPLLFIDATGVSAWASSIGGLLSVQAAFGADLSANYASWAWTDITSDVRYSGGIELVHGRGDEAADAQPAQCRILLDNRAGNYSLGPQSANYPDIRRGVPIRVLADVDDGDGWRILFWGAADAWNPTWAGGPSGDAVVALTASGALRRLEQGAAPVASTLRRVLATRSSMVAYWPMEDGAGADTAASAFPEHPPMTWTNNAPSFGDTSPFPCSAAVIGIDQSRLVFEVPPYTDTGAQQVRFLFVPPTSAPAADAVICRIYAPAGSAVLFDLTLTSGGALQLTAYDATGAVIDATALTTFLAGSVNLAGKPIRMSVELSRDGADVDCSVRFIEQGARSGFGPVSVTLTGETVEGITFVEINPQGTLEGCAVAHLSIQDDVTSQFTEIEEFNAFRFDTVEDRLGRLCDENDLSLQLSGTSDVVLGPQHPDTLVELLRECEATDQGILYDGRRPGITYIAREAREALDVDLTLDASTGQVDDLTPLDDDQRTRNVAEVTRREGSSAVFQDTDGPHGTATIGVYDESFTVNPGGDGVLADYASWFVHVGTIADGDYRHPALGLQLHRDPTLAAAWGGGLGLGSRIDVTNIDNIRTQHPDGTISLALEGYRQRIDQFCWFVDLVCSPYAPWRVGALAATSSDTSEHVLRLEPDGSTLASAVSAGATSMTVTTPVGPAWTTTADDFPLTVEVEGTPITVTAVTGSTSPQTFTVTGATVVRNLSAGAAVTIYQPRVLGLPEGG